MHNAQCNSVVVFAKSSTVRKQNRSSLTWQNNDFRSVRVHNAKWAPLMEEMK